MTPTKDQQAQEYAEKKVEECVHVGNFSQSARRRIQKFDSYDIEQAFEDGYTACEQSTWRSVEEELPEMEDRVLICEKLPNNQLEIFIDRRLYFMDSWDWGGARKENVVAWCPLPKYIPDTNTEKK